MNFTEAGSHAVSLLNDLDEMTSDEVEIWKPTVVDWKHSHAEQGGIRAENESDLDHPDAPDVPDSFATMYYRADEDRWEVKITQWDETTKRFDSFSGVKKLMKQIARSWDRDRERGERYGSRRRERRLRQDERR